MTRILLIGLAALAFSAAASAQRMQIQFAEPVEIPDRAGDVEFDAYGRRFTLSMTENDGLLARMPAARKAALPAVRLLRGSLQGQSGSWVRLTEYRGRVEGAIWDGRELYAVTTHSRIAGSLSTPLAAGPDDTVIYRVSDVLGLVPENFCATEPGLAAGNGLAQYNALVRDFKLQFVAVPTHQIDLSLIADVTNQQLYASGTEVTVSMLERLNIVDGIFDSQVGLVVTASDLRLAAPSPDPFTLTDSSGLLGQLRDYRAATPAVQSRAIAHLLTGRILDGGTTLGIAHLSGACDASNGVSLTSDRGAGNTMGTALTMAHEIAHNLSAVHDTDACGTNLLMWPTHSGSSTLSQCARTSIGGFLAAHASCVTSPQYADVTVEIDPVAAPGAVYDEPFTWPVRIRSIGNLPIADAEVYLSVNSGNVTPTYSPTQGSCAPTNGQVRCVLGAIAAGAEARVDINFPRATFPDTRLSAVVNASNERYGNNNLDEATELTVPQATIAASVTPTSSAVLSNQLLSHTFTVAASGLRTARGVRLNFGGYDAVTGFTSSQGSCNAISCNLGDIASGASATVTVQGYWVQAGSRRLGATLEATNASRTGAEPSANIQVTATRDLAIEISDAPRVATVGVTYELAFPIRVNAIQPINNGRFRFMAAGAIVESLTIDGVDCPQSDYAAPSGGGCVLGNMNPGDQRSVVIRFRFDSPMTTNLHVMAETDVDEQFGNNQYTLLFMARYGTDLAVRSPVGSGGLETSPLTATATISSLGSQDATNVSATFDVPVGLRVDSATLPLGTCTLDGTRRVTCTRATLARGTTVDMVVNFTGLEPASYTGNFTVAATNDGVPTNNASTIDILVRPRADVGIRPLTGSTALIVGETREVSFDVFTGPLRPARGVTITLPYLADFGLESLVSTVGSCRVGVPSATATDCNLGDLPVNASVRITARFRPTQGGRGLSGWVMAYSPDDSDSSNNNQELDLDSYLPGDVALRVDSATVTGVSGTMLALPRISLNTLVQAENIQLEMTLPSFAAIQTISGNAICTGTTQLQCWIGTRGAADTTSIDITLRLDAPGSFTSSLRVRAANDTNASNDATTLQIQSNAAAASSSGGGGGSSSGSSGGGKSGGGGSFDWLALLLLAGAAGTRRSIFRRALHDSITPRESGVMSRADR